ncbi:MAG TPA: hypothetical protein ENK23_08890, partial [Sorangium sp.]|nr:hypothetical protein [Sorangium sp.]
KRRMDYTVMGDVVNLAQRLQGKARVDTILVSEGVRHATGAAVVYHKVPPLRVKGRTKMVTAFEVVALSEHAVTNASPLVGRKKAAAKIKQVLLHATRKRVAGAMIIGAAGLGKTRLLDAASEWAEGAQLAVARARAGRLGRRQYLDVVQQLIVSLAGGTRSLQALADDGVCASSIVTLRRLVATSDTPAGHLPQDQRRVEHAAIIEAFQAAWTQRGLCIIVDDAHLLDAGSKQVLEELVMAGPKRQFALLAAARGGDSAKLLSRLPRIELTGLPAADLLQVACGALGIDALPSAAGEVLVQRADGNPLVAIEILRTLLERGDIVFDDNHWQLQRPLDVRVLPSRLASLVAARVDGLTPSGRALVRMAAVAGRSFHLEHVTAALTNTSDGHFDITATVDECSRRGFIERDPLSFHYQFPQQLVYDALLASLTDVDKRQLHLALAQALDRGAAPNATSFRALAHHYLQAGNSQRAARYLLASANALMRQHAFEDAASQLSMALSLAIEQLQQGDRATSKMAEYLYEVASKLIATLARNHTREAIKVADRVLPLLPTHLAEEGRAHVLHEHGAALNKVNDHAAAEQHLRLASELLAGAPETEQLARVRAELSASLEAQGRLVEAADTLIAGF